MLPESDLLGEVFSNLYNLEHKLNDIIINHSGLIWIWVKNCFSVFFKISDNFCDNFIFVSYTRSNCQNILHFPIIGLPTWFLTRRQICLQDHPQQESQFTRNRSSPLEIGGHQGKRAKHFFPFQFSSLANWDDHYTATFFTDFFFQFPDGPRGLGAWAEYKRVKTAKKPSNSVNVNHFFKSRVVPHAVGREKMTVFFSSVFFFCPPNCPILGDDDDDETTSLQTNYATWHVVVRLGWRAVDATWENRGSAADFWGFGPVWVVFFSARVGVCWSVDGEFFLPLFW